jgi:hypothetical protein
VVPAAGVEAGVAVRAHSLPLSMCFASGPLRTGICGASGVTRAAPGATWNCGLPFTRGVFSAGGLLDGLVLRYQLVPLEMKDSQA